ncbi:unnamed protein product [Symbiodinium natans]|uniref:Uncharacterized protein n=1 Tax=Symbiodinium natans TaxID=878477 RepID=A0A812U3J8_9DINO|nr:unnamed protein product [Symbiodinium natans]
MHLPQAIRHHLATRSRSPEDGQRANRPSRQGCPFGCFDCLTGQRLHVWCPMALLICVSVVCIGMFEAMRLSTHVLSNDGRGHLHSLRQPDAFDMSGTDLLSESLAARISLLAQIHPITTARLFVTFKHRHLDENITGTVWCARTAAACGGDFAIYRALLDAALSSYFGHPCKVANGQWHISEAEPCPTGESIKLDPKDFAKCKTAPAKSSEPKPFSCLPSVSAAAMAVEEVHLSSLACAEPSEAEEVDRGRESTSCTQMSAANSAACRVDAMEPEQEELFLDDDAESTQSPSATLAQILNSARRSTEDMRSGYDSLSLPPTDTICHGHVGGSPELAEGPLAPAELMEVGVEELQPAEDLVDEAVLVTENDVIARPAFGLGPCSRSMPAEIGRQDFDSSYGFGSSTEREADDIVVEDALAVEEEEPHDVEDQFTALALATEHLQSIESELQSHRDLIAREAEARRRLEDALLAERRRAEVEAQGRRRLEQEIEAEKQRLEDNRRKKQEAADLAVRLEEQRRLEEELASARRRAEEEARLAEERCEEQRRQAEKRRQLQEMEQRARESAAEAKREREQREKAKAFLAAEGYRHVRAAHKWSPVASYPLHRAVQCNDPEMVRLPWATVQALSAAPMDGGRCNEVKHLWVPDLVVLLVRSGGDLRAARQFLDQFALDLKSQRAKQPPGGPVPCTTADVLSHIQEQMEHADKATCYYSSRDERGEDVWLSIPSPGLVDHAWFQSHLEYPVLMALGSLVLLTLLLGCLAVEGAELYFSGIV